ncbi:HlyD family secretion protein [Chiayiivirga flava]|uniref:Membrane fusion protein (Multidrug efflux system) n=1 Tax=Chiayiivirga flava TaxID=659595 RepID=A0A7W8D9Q3_9GAMM|nr:HlyD family secretion protein [Chiayiivirga flava]MBB5208728.1 membrane fusion protein (multidrug efflux system) [Chiayiivirga flava]
MNAPNPRTASAAALDPATAEIVDAPAIANVASPAVAPAARPRRTRLLLWLAGPLVVAGVFAWNWVAGADAVSTDNAYVKADRVMIAPQVAGRVTQVLVAQNQRVEQGDLLFQLDTAPLHIALEQAQAQLAHVSDSSGANRAAMREADAALRAASETERWARQEFERQQELRGRGLVAQKALDDAAHALAGAKAERERAAAAVEKSRLTLGGKPGDSIESLPDYRAAKAAVEQAELDLAHAQVRAPVAGIVGSHDLQPGEYLNVGQAAFPLVAAAPVWIEANFKETDLERMRVGQHARIRIDSYPGREWDARIGSISPASGAEFSVLPPQNASGNWVKIVQRIPVRLELEDVPADGPPLRAGMSADVRVQLDDASDTVATS